MLLCVCHTYICSAWDCVYIEFTELGRQTCLKLLYILPSALNQLAIFHFKYVCSLVLLSPQYITNFICMWCQMVCWFYSMSCFDWNVLISLKDFYLCIFSIVSPLPSSASPHWFWDWTKFKYSDIFFDHELDLSSLSSSHIFINICNPLCCCLNSLIH